MGIPRMFKLPKHKSFNYVPRYYDPEKEEMAERRKKLAMERGLDISDIEHIPGEALRHGAMRGFFKKKERATIQSPLRVLIIIAILLAVAYWILFT
ncbi:MAG TPA: hypothetical protein VMW01_09250 [Williamwhitmania sp.]|nr:hypothetical protein [Williamwhitmania sp.]